MTTLCSVSQVQGAPPPAAGALSRRPAPGFFHEESTAEVGGKVKGVGDGVREDSKTLLVAPGITARSKKLLVTRASLLVARTLLVARQYFHFVVLIVARRLLGWRPYVNTYIYIIYTYAYIYNLLTSQEE